MGKMGKMDKLNEIKQFISDYRAVLKHANTIFGTYENENEIHADGITIHKLSAEIGVQAVLTERRCYEFPYEISITIDDFRIFGLMSFDEVKEHKLAKKCPMCNKQLRRG